MFVSRQTPNTRMNHYTSLLTDSSLKTMHGGAPFEIAIQARNEKEESIAAKVLFTVKSDYKKIEEDTEKEKDRYWVEQEFTRIKQSLEKGNSEEDILFVASFAGYQNIVKKLIQKIKKGDELSSDEDDEKLPDTIPELKTAMSKAIKRLQQISMDIDSLKHQSEVLTHTLSRIKSGLEKSESSAPRKRRT